MRKSVVLAAVVSVLIAAPAAVYAAHSFKDVAASNTFHADIEWLKNAGVTKGCNPPANDEFCPDDPVTRAQMSAFMRRLAENRVVDAGSLDGQDGAAYGNPVVNVIDGGPVAPGTAVKLAELSIETPASGGLRIDASVVAGTSAVGQPSLFLFWLQVDSACEISTTQLESVMFGYLRLADSSPTSGPVVGTAAVPAGNHTVTLCGATALSGVGAIGSLVAEYSTSVDRSATPLSASDLLPPELIPDQ